MRPGRIPRAVEVFQRNLISQFSVFVFVKLFDVLTMFEDVNLITDQRC